MSNKTFFYKWEQLVKYQEKPYYDANKGISKTIWIEEENYQQSQEKLYKIIPEDIKQKFDSTVSYQSGTTLCSQRVPKENEKHYLPIIYKTLPIGYFEDFVHLIDNTFYGSKKDLV